MYRRLLLLLLFICCFFPTLFSQSKGYNIKIILPQKTDSKLFLEGYYGDQTILFDSAKIRNNCATFKGKTALPDGYYNIIDEAHKTYTDLLIDYSRHFTITLPDSSKPKTVENSPETQALFEFMNNLKYMENNQSMMDYIQQFTLISPESLLSKNCKLALYSVQPEREYSVDNYFEYVNLQDARMLRIPFFNTIVTRFFEESYSNPTDNITFQKEKIIHFFSKCNPDSEIGQYYLQKLIKRYNTDGNTTDDVILTFLYDQYCAKGNCQFLSETNARILKNTVARKKRLLPGEQVPFLSAYNSSHKLENSKDIAKDYIILWFWDPDCEDCLIETPLLHTFYLENATNYNFEVYAVAITEDTTKWKDALEKMQLSWINTSNGMGEPNYDFVDYFNLLTTPASFLIDKNHKIIMRNFSLNELDDFFKFKFSHE